MSARVRVVLVDDHPRFREGVAHALQPEADFEVVGQGASGAEAQCLARELLPDLLLLDINMPGGGLAAVQEIAAASPSTKIVMLTGSEDEDDVRRALQTGAHGYILKGTTSHELRTALRAIVAGALWVTATLTTGLLSEMHGQEEAD